MTGIGADVGAGTERGNEPGNGAGRSARGDLAGLVARGISWDSFDPPTSPDGVAGRPAAVLVLFGVLDGDAARRGGGGEASSAGRSGAGRSGAGASGGVSMDLDVLLVGRAETLTHHSGQIAFPGGRIDPGDTGPVDAAIREAVEETGLDPAGVEVLGTLGELPLPVSNHLVTPVLAWWARPSPVDVVDLGESAAVFRAPVADLLDPDLRRTATLTRGDRVFRTPAFLVGAHVVWGFTAMVLDVLFDELGWTEPWDRSRTIDVVGSIRS